MKKKDNPFFSFFSWLFVWLFISNFFSVQSLARNLIFPVTNFEKPPSLQEENAQLKSRVDCLEKEMKTLKQQLSQQTNFFAALQITIFILATSFAILAMTHNSLYGIAIRFWGISHSFWSSLWNYIQVDLFQGDNFKLFAIGSMVLHLLVFWVGNGLFLLVDLTGKPEVLKKFKVSLIKCRDFFLERSIVSCFLLLAYHVFPP